MKTTRTRVAILDVDNTIADCSHRLKHIEGKERSKEDWDLFWRLAHYDSPMEDHITFIKRYLKKNKLQPVFITGRSGCIQRDTHDWIKKHFKPKQHSVPNDFGDYIFGVAEYNYGLYMRSEEDRRPASEVKRDHLHKLLDEYAVEAVFDDDGVCVEMYKKELKHYPCKIFTVRDFDGHNLPPFYETI